MGQKFVYKFVSFPEVVKTENKIPFKVKKHRFSSLKSGIVVKNIKKLSKRYMAMADVHGHIFFIFIQFSGKLDTPFGVGFPLGKPGSATAWCCANTITLPSSGYKGAMPPPSPMKISHTKDGRFGSRIDFMFLARPLPDRWIRYWTRERVQILNSKINSFPVTGEDAESGAAVQQREIHSGAP